MVKIIVQSFDDERICEVRPEAMETAAELLLSFRDRAPSSERAALERIADAFNDIAANAIAAEREAR